MKAPLFIRQLCERQSDLLGNRTTGGDLARKA
jgi:hypothetical protein